MNSQILLSPFIYQYFTVSTEVLIFFVDYDLPRGCKIITVFLTDDELEEILPCDQTSRRHCHSADFSPPTEAETKISLQSCQGADNNRQKTLFRRKTCPNFNHTNKSGSQNVSQKALQSFLSNERQKPYFKGHESLVWGGQRSSLPLSHVPIVECQNYESDVEVSSLYDRANYKHFGEVYNSVEDGAKCKADVSGTYKQVEISTACDNELSETESESENNNEVFEDSVDDTKDLDCSKDISYTQELGSEISKHSQSGRSTVKTNVEKVISVVEEENPSISDLEEEDEKVLTLTDQSEGVEKHNPRTHGSSERNISRKSTEIDNTGVANENVKSNIEEDSCKGDSFVECISVEEESPKIDSVIKATEINLSISSEDDLQARFYDTSTDDHTQTLIKNSTFRVQQHTVHIHAESKVHDSTEEESHIGEEESSCDNVQADKTENDTDVTSGVHNKSMQSTKNVDLFVNETVESGAKMEDRCLNAHDVEDKTGINKENDAVDIDSVSKNSEEFIKMDAGSHGNTDGGITESDQVRVKGCDIVDTISKTSPKLERSVERINDEDVIVSEIHNKDNNTNSITKTTYVDDSDKNKTLKETKSLNGEQSDDSGKENSDPTFEGVYKSKRTSPDERKDESEIETEDEGISLASFEPCINCLEIETVLREKNRRKGNSVIRCEECIAKFKKRRLFGSKSGNQEVIDFGGKVRDRYESGAETDSAEIDGMQNKDDNGYNPDSETVLSNAVSMDSSISKYWTKAMDGLNYVTLYVQCHSEISLLLLLDSCDEYDKQVLHSLVSIG